MGRTKSLFGLDELQNAGGILEEAGLNLTRVLPLVNTLGNALGGTQGKALAAANALRNIAEEPTRRDPRQFGINASDFRSVGGVFSRNGKLVKDFEATFSEIEAIIKRKFGNVDSYLQDTFARRVAGLKNSFEVASTAFGEGFLSDVREGGGQCRELFGYLSDSSLASTVGKNLAEGFDSLLGKGDFFNKAISLGVAALDQLPTILSESWKWLTEIGATVKTLFKDAVNGIGDFLHSVINSAVSSLYSGLNTICHTAGDLLKTASSIVDLIPGHDPLTSAKLYGQGARLLSPHNDLVAPRFFEDGKGNNTLTSDNLGKSLSALGKFAEPQFIADIFNRGREIYRGFPGQTPTAAKAVASNVLFMGDDAAGAQKRFSMMANIGQVLFFTRLYEPLQQIASATRITAENTGRDLKKFALGGGPLGQLGATPVEFQAFRTAEPGAVLMRRSGYRLMGGARWKTQLRKSATGCWREPCSGELSMPGRVNARLADGWFVARNADRKKTVDTS